MEWMLSSNSERIKTFCTVSYLTIHACLLSTHMTQPQRPSFMVIVWSTQVAKFNSLRYFAAKIRELSLSYHIATGRQTGHDNSMHDKLLKTFATSKYTN